MEDLLHPIFDTTGFPTRWHVGFGWEESPWVAWALIISDLVIFASYAFIPVVLLAFTWRRRLPFPKTLSLVAVFIFCCGLVHLVEAGLFLWPAYRFAAVVKMATAIVSVITFVALFPILKRALRLRAPETLEREVQRQTRKLRRAQQLNSETHARLRAIVDTAGDGIITIDARGIIESVNPAVEVIFGYSNFELIGKSIGTLMPEPYRSEHGNYLAKYRQTNKASVIGQSREFEGKRKDGTVFPLELSVSETKIEDKTYFIGIVRDITQRREHEEEMRKQVRQRERFLAILSHELRNPMGAVVNAARLLKSDEALLDDVGRDEATNVIVRQSQHMSRLLDDLLDTARITQNKIELRREAISLREMMHDVRQCVEHLVGGKSQELICSAQGGSLTVWGDPARLRQAQVNLLANASKYTPAGGRIEFNIARQQKEVVITVRDCGDGIPANLLEHLFDPFVQRDDTLHRNEGGMGIGLFLTRSIVRAHGGTISVHSGGANCGSEFEIRLPWTAAPKARQAKIQHFSFEGRRLLIVEDNDDARTMLSQLVRMKGFDVFEANNGRTALESFAQHLPEAVLLDIGLPEIDGYEVARQIRERPSSKDVVLIALTGYGQPSDRQATQAAGFDAHLVKPLDPGKLFKVLTEKLSQRTIA